MLLLLQQKTCCSMTARRLAVLWQSQGQPLGGGGKAGSAMQGDLVQRGLMPQNCGDGWKQPQRHPSLVQDDHNGSHSWGAAWAPALVTATRVHQKTAGADTSWYLHSESAYLPAMPYRRS